MSFQTPIVWCGISTLTLTFFRDFFIIWTHLTFLSVLSWKDFLISQKRELHSFSTITYMCAHFCRKKNFFLVLTNDKLWNFIIIYLKSSHGHNATKTTFYHKLKLTFRCSSTDFERFLFEIPRVFLTGWKVMDQNAIKLKRIKRLS